MTRTEPAARPRTPHGGNPEHPASHGGGLFGLALGALGIIFGDIGAPGRAGSGSATAR